LGHGGGVATTPDRSACETDALQIVSRTPVNEPSRIEDELEQISPALADSVVEGHRALNCNRPILAGEWYELLALQDAHGAEQLLIWQARASRAVAARSFGITPSYYRTCAARSACDAYAPRRPDQAITPVAHNLAHDITSPKVALDPACDALLQAMGVRERHKLGAVPYDLIAAWQMALAHPGLAAQFTSPVGFAVAQLQRGNRPPPITELERWAEQARHSNDRYESWRYLEHPAATVEQTADERQLEARVRALAPADADLADLCALARAIEAGATDSEALAQIHAKQSGGWG
jgi:hypothetical protein